MKKRIIEYNNQTFCGYLELAYYLLNNHIEFNNVIFPSNRMYLLRILLENKFDRKFTWKETKEILDDKPWQWRTREQTQEVINERYKDAKPVSPKAIMGSRLPWKTLEYTDGKWQYRLEDLV